MKKEFKALQNNATWELISWQISDNAINTKWVFKVKPKNGGTIERFKARLVANGIHPVSVQPLERHGLFLRSDAPTYESIIDNIIHIDE